MEIQKIVYGDYNSALRNGVKIIETVKLTDVQSAAMRGRYDKPETTSQHLEVRKDRVCNNLTTVQKDSLVIETHTGFKEVPEIFQKFIYEINGELYLIRIRKLTPLECWRLMGFYDSDYEKASSVNSNTQLYKQAGNSIVKQVLMAVFSQMVKPQDSRTVFRLLCGDDQMRMEGV